MELFYNFVNLDEGMPRLRSITFMNNYLPVQAKMAIFVRKADGSDYIVV